MLNNRLHFLIYTLLAFVMSCSLLFAEEEIYLPTPDGRATAQLGFNYDYLRDPLSIDFEKGAGYFAVNIPLFLKAGSGTMDRYFAKINERTTDGEYFTPEITVQQFANTTIRVDFPLLGGIATFSHINIFKFEYENNLGVPTVLYRDSSVVESDTTDIVIRGALNVPAQFRIGWETLNFGYAYRFTDLFSASLMMSRHSFYFDVYGNVDMDLLGNISYRGATVNKDVPLDYSLHSSIDGYYKLHTWTPTITAKMWRFTAIARFGFSKEAEGSLVGDYEVPFFVDPKTFQPDPDLGDPQYLIDNMNRFENSEVTHVNLTTSKPIQWSLPHGLTVKFDIVPQKLMISYTKFIGTMNFSLNDTLHNSSDNTVNKVISINSVSTIDHIILLNGRFNFGFFNFGVFSFETSMNNNHSLLSGARVLPNFGKGVLVPIVTGGVVIGGKFQVIAEADILPFAAIKLAVQYHFRKTHEKN